MPRIFKIFEITRTIYLNVERSEQLEKEHFFNLVLEVLIRYDKYIGKIRMSIGTNTWHVETNRNKLKNNFVGMYLFLFIFVCFSSVNNTLLDTTYLYTALKIP